MYFQASLDANTLLKLVARSCSPIDVFALRTCQQTKVVKSIYFESPGLTLKVLRSPQMYNTRVYSNENPGSQR